MKKKTILVTGGAGFIGSHLIEELVKDPNNQVISLDNYFTGSKKNHVEEAEYCKGDTRDIGQHISEKPDIVYHLGEYARVEQSFDDVETVWEFNTEGTFRVLEFCRKNGSKLVYAGSSTKFGDNGLGIHQSPYAWTKATNTELVKNYGEWFELPYAVVYFYNVYGPRERAGSYGTVIEIFKQQHKAGSPLTVTSPGMQRRNFTHVKDIITGLLLVGERGEGDEYGLGDEHSYSVLEVAEMFGGEIKMLPERKGNRMDAGIDISKAKALGWRVEHGIEDYIKEIVSSK